MPRPIAYKTGTIQPPNTAKQNNVIVGVGPSNWGAGAANATFYNGLDSTFQYVVVTGSNPPAFWGTGDFTTASLLTTLNGLPDRVGQTRFTNANTAISSSLATGKYTILKNEQVYGGPITNGLVMDFCPKVSNYFANGDFAYGTTIGWVGYGGSPFIYDITNDKPYVGSKSTKALANTGGGFTWGRYTSPIYGPGGLLVVGNTYTFSFWVKKISGTDFNLRWDNQNGSGDNSSWTDNSAHPVTTTWTKYTQTFTYNISKNFFYLTGNYAADSQYIITELQLEDGTTANTFSAFPVTAAGLTIPNNGLINSSSFSLVNGPYLVAENQGVIRFDGVDDYVDCGTPLTFTDSFTLNYWFKTTNTDSIKVMNGMYNGSGADWWIGILGNNKFNFSFGSPSKSDISSLMTVNDGVWRYASCVYDKNINSIFLYINGSLQSTSNTIPSTVTQPGGTVSIGRFGSNGGFQWPGSIGSYQIYNKALSASEIENLYTAGLPTYQSSSSIMVNQGLTLYLDATNPNCYPGSGTSIYDLSGYGNNGTLYNGVAYSSTYGGGLVFDGVDDYIVIPGNGTVNASKPTVELVMTTSTNGGNIIAQGQYGSNWGFGVGVKSGAIMARNNNGDANYSVSNSGLVHVVVVWDGSGNQYYKNGQYLGRTTANYSPNPGGDVTIGGVRNQVPQSTLTEFANSTVNIVRIYNRALSPTEILQNFNSIKTQFGL